MNTTVPSGPTAIAEAGPVTLSILGNYGPAAGSSVIGRIPSTGNSGTNGAYTLAPSQDFYGNNRKTNSSVDAGAVEFVAAANTPVASVTGGPLDFGNVLQNTTSSAQTLTLHNTGTASVTGITLTFSDPHFSRPAGVAGGTCGATLTVATGNCTINVVFTPTVISALNATLTIASNVSVTGSPVSLTGAGVGPIVSATLTPTTWTPTHVRNCPTPVVGCALDPVQAFTLTNTGNVTLTGIVRGVLGGTNSADFTLRPALSTCGPAGGTQLIGRTTLAPGATCVITVQFQPLTSEAVGTKTATVSVTDAAGTQQSILSGTAQ